MFATRVRVRPWSARCSPRSVGRVTTSSSPCCSTLISRLMRSVSSPFGPLTVTRSGSIAIVTPEGMGMGRLPIRDIAAENGLPDLRHDLAADATLARLVAGHNSARGRDDGCAHPALNARNVGVVDIRALARPRNALDPRDDRLAVVGVLERH